MILAKKNIKDHIMCGDLDFVWCKSNDGSKKIY